MNQTLLGLPILVGARAIWKEKPRKLLFYLPGVVAFLTVWRRYVCARCQYYGRECSTMLGVLTAAMMPRDETRPLDRNTMIADFTFIGILAVVPLPQVMRRPRMALVYLLSMVVGMGAILFNACGRCGNDFCPMKDLRRKLTQ